MHCRIIIATLILIAIPGAAATQDWKPWFFITAKERFDDVVKDAADVIAKQTGSLPNVSRLEKAIKLLNPHVANLQVLPGGTVMVLPDARMLAVQTDLQTDPPLVWFTCRQINTIIAMAGPNDGDLKDRLRTFAAAEAGGQAAHGIIFHVIALHTVYNDENLIYASNLWNGVVSTQRFGSRFKRELRQLIKQQPDTWANLLRQIG